MIALRGGRGRQPERLRPRYMIFVYIIYNLDQGSATNSSSAPAASLGGTTIEPDGVREKLTPARDRAAQDAGFQTRNVGSQPHFCIIDFHVSVVFWLAK